MVCAATCCPFLQLHVRSSVTRCQIDQEMVLRPYVSSQHTGTQLSFDSISHENKIENMCSELSQFSARPLTFCHSWWVNTIPNDAVVQSGVADVHNQERWWWTEPCCKGNGSECEKGKLQVEKRISSSLCQSERRKHIKYGTFRTSKNLDLELKCHKL